MNTQFINPIALSFKLLNDYQTLLKHTLAAESLTQDDQDAILSNIEVDRGLFFSLNRKYKQGDVGFIEFCRQQRLAQDLPNMLPLLRHLYIHQQKAIESIGNGQTTIISTGTGSGKTESFLIPILDYCLKHPGEGIKALIIYPMNALAGDQLNRLARYTDYTAQLPQAVTFGSYTGATPQRRKPNDRVTRLGIQQRLYRDEILKQPPSILVTNYVMLDWLLTNPDTARLFSDSADTLRFIVIDELHSYRGNKATHLKYLLRRLKSLCRDPQSLVQIGTSATLADPQSGGGGYLGQGKGDRLDDFIKPLLDVMDYAFITPEYEAEQAPTKQNPIKTDLPPGWALDIDNDAGRKLLHALTGHAISEGVLLEKDRFLQSAVYQALQADEFVVTLRQRLIDGAQSFGDLVQLFNQLLPTNITVDRPEEIVQAYLSALAFANHHAESQPLLDFRIHLFLRDIGGSLKRCIRCQKYHSGGQDICAECGYPLFYVLREDVSCCIGKVSGHRLKWELRPESDDRKNAYYVRIAFAAPGIVEDAEKTESKALRFNIGNDPAAAREELPLRFDPAGRLQLSLLPIQHYNDIDEALIHLIDGRKDYQYLHQITRTLLDAYTGDKVSRKCLAFIDNREKASRLSSVLQDEFATEFFESYLQLYYPAGADWNIRDTLPRLQALASEEDFASDLEPAIFRELALWYWRWLGIPTRYVSSLVGLLKIKNADEFNDLECAILQLFIDERAIAHDFEELFTDSKFIRFDKYFATSHRAVRVAGDEGSKASDDSRHSSVVLTDEHRIGQKSAERTVYYEFVQRYGLDAIHTVISELVERGVLVENDERDEKDPLRPRLRLGHYYLRPEYVCFDTDVLERYVGANRANDYQELRARLLLVADLHSSEVKSERRSQIEANFQDGKTQFLLATPTLEMGIDIGKLQNVLMIGVPPLPSNYAQRAGRAGRGSGQNYALIITFCLEDNNHDIYYFANPKQMINGVISPPTFNPANEQVLQRHINAFILAPFLKDRRSLRDFRQDYDRYMPDQIDWANQIFGDMFNVKQYLAKDFKLFLEKKLGTIQARKLPPRTYLYDSGFFPDYSFRRDGVSLVSEDSLKVLKKLDQSSDTPDDLQIDPPDIAEYALSSREPEMAYYKFVPGETAYVGGEIYTVLTDGDYVTVNSDTSCGVSARSYRYVAARKQIRFATKSKMYNRYGSTVEFDGNEQAIKKQGVLSISYAPECHLRLYNCGIKRASSIEPFQDEDGAYAICYDLPVRQALILEFDPQICRDERYALSLASCLDRTIKDIYGLDESEIRLIAPPPKDEDAPLAVVLYDFDGNGNVPFGQIYADFDTLIAYAYNKMQQCTCKDGCYQCMRSYGTHYYAGSITKELALMFTGFLLGRNVFLPAVSQSAYVPPPDLTLSVSLKGHTITVGAGASSYSDSWTNDQNRTIFRTIIHAIRAEFHDHMSTLLIQSSVQYIVEAINTGAIKQNREDFSALQFELLRFSNVTAQVPL